MTTTIHDFYESGTRVEVQHLVRPDCPTTVEINGTQGGRRASVSVAPAEFLAAVATELDVIIINRADLPPVTASTNTNPTVFSAGNVCYGHDDDPARLRVTAFAHLAIAEYLSANPPVDEAQVEALARIIRDSDTAEGLTADELDNAYHLTIARALVRAGVRAPEEAGQ